MISKEGQRQVPYAKFHRGYKQMDLAPNELLRAIRLPRTTAPLQHYYRKVGTRKAQAISKTCFAAVGRVADDHVVQVRIALGSVAPIPLRCAQAESKLLHKRVDADSLAAARAALAAEISPIDDLRSTRNYRLRVSLNLLEDFLQSLRMGP